MSDLGFLPEVVKLLDMMPKQRQTMLFSATLDGDVDELVRRHQNKPVRHDLVGDAEQPDIEYRWEPCAPSSASAGQPRSSASTARPCSSRQRASVPNGSSSSSVVPASKRPRSTVGLARVSASERSTRSARAAIRRSSAPMSPPAASTSTTCRWCCSGTSRPTPRTSCTVRAGRRAPVRPGSSSSSSRRSTTAARCASWRWWIRPGG